MMKNNEKETQTTSEQQVKLMLGQGNRLKSLKPMRSVLAVRSLKPRTTVSKEMKKS